MSSFYRVEQIKTELNSKWIMKIATLYCKNSVLLQKISLKTIDISNLKTKVNY